MSDFHTALYCHHANSVSTTTGHGSMWRVTVTSAITFCVLLDSSVTAHILPMAIKYVFR